MSQPILPFWALQRQITSESVDEHTVRLTGPILPVCEVRVAPSEPGPGHQVAVTRVDASGAKEEVIQTVVPATEPLAAWQAGFELYRQHVIV
ncbi:MAG TPA: hypothetical protein PKC45_09530 [Gemmatales bacterium]|nr:hypothetical protein [Gemmatales bacterium]